MRVCHSPQSETLLYWANGLRCTYTKRALFDLSSDALTLCGFLFRDPSRSKTHFSSELSSPVAFREHGSKIRNIDIWPHRWMVYIYCKPEALLWNSLKQTWKVVSKKVRNHMCPGSPSLGQPIHSFCGEFESTLRSGLQSRNWLRELYGPGVSGSEGYKSPWL